MGLPGSILLALGRNFLLACIDFFWAEALTLWHWDWRLTLGLAHHRSDEQSMKYTREENSLINAGSTSEWSRVFLSALFKIERRARNLKVSGPPAQVGQQ